MVSSHSAHLFSLKRARVSGVCPTLLGLWEAKEVGPSCSPPPMIWSRDSTLLPPTPCPNIPQDLKHPDHSFIGVSGIPFCFYPGGNRSREEGKYTENCFLRFDGDPCSLRVCSVDPSTLLGGGFCCYSQVRKLDFMPMVPKGKFHLFPSFFLQDKTFELEDWGKEKECRRRAGEGPGEHCRWGVLENCTCVVYLQ